MSARFALGLGGTVDYEVVWDARVLEDLAAEHVVTLADLDTGRAIGDERDLLCTLLAFVRDGVGGERFVASSDIITGLARHLEVRVTLGGTCVRAAMAMDAVGLPATVHLVSIDDTVRRLLPASTSYLCSAREDSLDPHLIVQFAQGERVRLADGEVVAPRSNRIIYVNDPPNRDLVIDDAWADEVAVADVVLVSGFNVMQERELLDDRLATVRADLERVPQHGIVYFEDAGYHLPEFSRRVRDVLAPVVDVWAMNEDELEWWLGREVDLLDVDDVRQALQELAVAVPARVRVLHTKSWALAHGPGAGRFRESLRSGIVMGATRYLVGDAFSAPDLATMCARPCDPVAVAFSQGLTDVVPDVVCEPGYDVVAARPTTIGLGDTFVGGFLTGLAGSDAVRR
ncbi:hypothetical protein GCM10009718_20610 [Isoptericola halotolerans]|uniref:ADP-dependent phosphofructokinase/glucokinase n=1 Tax=Isoptericola halotolerans TaxID=300560 RepID=A0ABX2AA19_9MICO|nr:ADP-dependent glucokinase/phosphofructokinase [Isoptericola halotolerans]NOV99005.1 ADP-dependent phosphofructokinase/glucokinase [Isoptericola halotolerans]